MSYAWAEEVRESPTARGPSTECPCLPKMLLHCYIACHEGGAVARCVSLWPFRCRANQWKHNYSVYLRQNFYRCKTCTGIHALMTSIPINSSELFGQDQAAREKTKRNRKGRLFLSLASGAHISKRNVMTAPAACCTVVFKFGTKFKHVKLSNSQKTSPQKHVFC